MTTTFNAFDRGFVPSDEPVPAGGNDYGELVDAEHVDAEPGEKLCDEATERDLFRIVTNRLYMPPPATADDPAWDEAWTHFGRIYEPALRVYVCRVLSKHGFDDQPFLDAEDIVQDFIHTRLEDGRLHNEAGHIDMFRAWLSTQVAAFTFSWMRARTAQRRCPAKPFMPADAIQRVAVMEPGPDALIAYREQIALEITELVLDRVGRRSKTYARIIRDLIGSGGTTSYDLAEELRVPPHRMADLRRRARQCFRHELVRVFRRDLVPEGNISDLVEALKRLLNRKRRRGAT